MGDNPIVHRTKLFGGRHTAQELHRKLAWNNANCSACGGPAAMQVQTFVLLSDMSLDTRLAIEFQVSLGKLHVAKLGAGRAIRIGLMYACKSCSPALERQAAHPPKSYCIVDIDRGPGEDKPVVGVIAPVQ